MTEQTKQNLRALIDQAKIVSFDVFDTLLFRKTNTPETVFDLVGRHFGIHGFRKLRMDSQNIASARAYQAFGWPHADMDQIYEVLSEQEIPGICWQDVKDYEIRLERDALTANTEMLEFFRYAREQGKRVIAVSDMYLFAAQLETFLEDNGFTGFDRIYCSADEHHAKFNRDLFAHVAQQEGAPYGDFLHIGDKDRDDGEFPGEFGMKTFVYHRDCDLEKLKNAGSSDVDKGIYKILCGDSSRFWYNLGVEVGGPLYMGLTRFLLEKAGGRKIFLLSRDGYNLHRILRELGYTNVEYLHTSRRAMTLAGITRMDEKDIANLPPYTFGQTVGEILDYLCVDRESIRHLEEAGLRSFDQLILQLEDMENFRKLYALNKEVFLERCRTERENARKYLEKIGFLNQDAICFDCGWQGSSQLLLERFKEAIGCEKKHPFLYFGIRSGEKSRRQLRGMHYEAYLFDHYKNYALQADFRLNVAMYELFFSAPHESVYIYDENGDPVYEQGQGEPEKEALLWGISDYMKLGWDFVRTHDVEFTPELSAGHLSRLIHLPTETEALTIGSLHNVDGFARKQGQTKYIAYVTREQLESNHNQEIYWIYGLLKRPDVPEDVKCECARRLGVEYPAVHREYHLEDPQSIRNYHRFLRARKEEPQDTSSFTWMPRFSVVIPVYNTVTEQLEACFDSVLNQTYREFELILVDDHSPWPNVKPVLQRYETHPQVKVIYRSANGHISAATNDGIAQASGDFIVFMDCDDTIDHSALFAFAKKLNENPELDFIYSDEDKLTEDGKIRHQPFFKPEWSPNLFLSMMYTNHLATYRTSIVKAVGGLRTAYNGSQDYDFTLRFMEKSHNKRVGHVAKILYHWRERKESVAYAMNSKNYAAEASRYAKEDYIRRNGLNAHMEFINGMSQYRIVYEVTGSPLVSIVIPSKDHLQILRQCIDSLGEFTDYPNYEIIVVDNGSTPANREAIAAYLDRVGAQYIYEPREFNFSAMCNAGAARARGEYLLFLNDDIELFQPQWLRRMLGQAQQKDVGAVGAKLYYPQSSLIQHVGVSNPPEDGPLHTLMTLDDQVPYSFGWNRVDYDCICVTGACLLVQAEKFRQAGCFDEKFPIAYNDVKLCFSLHRLGYYNVLRNDAVAYHCESLSRGSDQVDDRKLIRMNRERMALFREFPELLDRDPYLSGHLRRYWSVLEPRDNVDELRLVELRDCMDGDKASIDFVEVGDQVRIVGWATLAGEPRVEELRRWLVFADPHGKAYAALTLPFPRPDVAEHLGSPDFEMAGFECVLSRKDLRVDLMRYRMGVMIEDREGRMRLCWCSETNIIRSGRPRPIAAPMKIVKDFRCLDNPQGVRWYLDECCRKEDHFLIRGFAHVERWDHYRYSKRVILRSPRETLSLEVQAEERVDVAYTFPREHFLYNTGFCCYVYDGMLEPGMDYQVILRLENRFDPQDVRDIVTGGHIITENN